MATDVMQLPEAIADRMEHVGINDRAIRFRGIFAAYYKHPQDQAMDVWPVSFHPHFQNSILGAIPNNQDKLNKFQ
jgi:hypothetical protein